MSEDTDTSGLSELEIQTLATRYACDEVERLTRENEDLRKRLEEIASLLFDLSNKIKRLSWGKG